MSTQEIADIVARELRKMRCLAHTCQVVRPRGAWTFSDILSSISSPLS